MRHDTIRALNGIKIEDAKKLFRDKTLDEIMEMYPQYKGRETALRSMLYTHAIFFKRRHNKKVTSIMNEARDEDIVNMRNRGVSFKKIGEKYGISRQRVFQVYQQMAGK